MDHGGEAARLTTVESTVVGLAGAVQGSESNIGSGAFDGQLGADAAPTGSFSDFDLSAVTGGGVVPVAAEFHLHRQTGPGVAYANIGEFWQQPSPVGVVLVGPHLPDGVMPVYSVLQPRPGAGRGVVLVDLLPGGGGGVVYNWDYTLQPHPAAGHGEVLVNLLPDGAGQGEVLVGLLPGVVEHGDVLVDLLPNGAGHGEVFVGPLPGGGGGVVHDDYGYYPWQPHPGVGSGEVFIGLLPDGAGHGEVFVGLLPGGGGAVHDDYGYYPWQPRPGVGSGEVFIVPLPDGVGVVFDGLGNFAQQTLPVIGRADRITGALRGRDLGEGYDGSGALANDLGAGYDNRGTVAEHLRRLLPFAGIGACSMAINGIAVGPGSPAVAFHLFVLLLGGLFLVILHVLRV